MEYRPAVMAVIVNENDEFLIGSSPRDGGYKFPQGGIDEGESPIETLIRELNEEIGVDIKENDIIGDFGSVTYFYRRGNTRDGFVAQKNIVFKIKYNEKMNPVAQDNEFDELIWITSSEFEKYDYTTKKDAYYNAIKLCGLL